MEMATDMEGEIDPDSEAEREPDMVTGRDEREDANELERAVEKDTEIAEGREPVSDVERADETLAGSDEARADDREWVSEEDMEEVSDDESEVARDAGETWAAAIDELRAIARRSTISEVPMIGLPLESIPIPTVSNVIVGIYRLASIFQSCCRRPAAQRPSSPSVSWQRPASA